MSAAGAAKPPRLLFRRAQRLTRALDYQAAYADRVTRTRGPLVVFARRNALGHARLGLSVGRKVGNAVVRNLVKRLLREAFRLHQRELPTGLDLVVNVRPHKPLTVEDYREHLLDAAASLSRQLERADAGKKGGADRG